MQSGLPFSYDSDTSWSAPPRRAHGNVALAAQARPAAADGPLVARLRAAGLIFAGRTSSSEFGTVPAADSVAWGVTRNPWDTALFSGGSSGGAAAAVAAGMAPAAHGTDAGGSIRAPASCCGLVGLKPSRAAGHAVDSVFDLIAESAVTRSVRDSALLLDISRDTSGAGGYLAASSVEPGHTAHRGARHPARRFPRGSGMC